MTIRKPSRKSDVLAAIDFGTTKICAIIGRVGDEGLEIIGIGKQPSLGIRKGVVVNIPTTVDALKKAVEVAELMAGCEISTAHIGIAGLHIRGFNTTGVVAVKHREVGREDVERAIEAARAVALPVDREILHVIPQEFSVGDQDGVRDPIGMAGGRLESKVHIVTGAVSCAQNMVKCASEAGISVADVVLEPLASAEAVLSPDEKELGVALVDIGGGTTDVALFVRGSVVHTGILSVGGNHITNDIAVGLRTSLHDAENIKVQSGCAMHSQLSEDLAIQVASMGSRKAREVQRSALAKIIEPRVEEIFSLVAQEIANSGYKHLLSSGVVITGGASLLDGVIELGEFVLEMPVRRGVPQGVGGLSDVVNSPIYSTAVGLLIHAMRSRGDSRFRLGIGTDGVYSKAVARVRAWLGEVF